VQRNSAAGWDGDRYEVYESATKNRAVVWASVWDTVADAEEFAAAYQKYVDRRVRQMNEFVGNGSTKEIETNSTSRWNVLINQAQDRVVIVQGIDIESAQAVMSESKQFTTQEKNFSDGKSIDKE
jgi:alkanesulfonate monooxygenase SsuD/methylene tetrahydromethanopterin reductase-like flavin-dependent oxidoreductase (luciferase family)